MHWPKVSEKKKIELEQLKISLKTPVVKRKTSALHSLGYHTYDDNHSTHGYTAEQRSTSENPEHPSIQVSRYKPVVWKENSMKPKIKEKKEAKIIDYLKEQRLAYQTETVNSVSVSTTKNHDWKKELQKMQLQGKDRYDLYLDKARELEEKAQRK